MLTEFRDRPASRSNPASKIWRRLLPLAIPAALGLIFLGAAQYGHGAPAFSRKTSSPASLKSRLVALLENPLGLLNARSPGGRPAGPLQLSKPDILPHERVLSEEREHSPPPTLLPGAESPAFAANAPAVPGVPGGFANIPGQGGIAPTSFSPFNAPFSIFNAFLPPPGSTSSGPGNSSTPSIPNAPLTGIPPGDLSTIPSDTGTPPGDIGPPASGGDTSPIPIPEPASWSLMFFGGLGVAMTRRRLWRKLPAQGLPVAR